AGASGLVGAAAPAAGGKRPVEPAERNAREKGARIVPPAAGPNKAMRRADGGGRLPAQEAAAYLNNRCGESRPSASTRASPNARPSGPCTATGSAAAQGPRRRW